MLEIAKINCKKKLCLHVDPKITTSLLFLILDAASEVRFVLDQHVQLDFYSANTLKQKSAGRHVAPL